MYTGRIASGDIFVVDRALKQSIYQEFGAAAESFEIVEKQTAALACAVVQNLNN